VIPARACPPACCNVHAGLGTFKTKLFMHGHLTNARRSVLISVNSDGRIYNRFVAASANTNKPFEMDLLILLSLSLSLYLFLWKLRRGFKGKWPAEWGSMRPVSSLRERTHAFGQLHHVFTEIGVGINRFVTTTNPNT